ncbi:uncharacterized protein METZ01_LOCUS335827, partial [marine metagenome]
AVWSRPGRPPSPAVTPPSRSTAAWSTSRWHVGPGPYSGPT